MLTSPSFIPGDGVFSQNGQVLLFNRSRPREIKRFNSSFFEEITNISKNTSSSEYYRKVII